MCMSVQCSNLGLSYVPEQQFRQFGRACMQPCRLCRRPRSHKTISIVVLHLTGPCIYVVVLEMFLVDYKISTCKFSSNSRLVTIERMHGMPVGCLYRWHAGEVWTQLAQGDKLCVAKDRLNCQRVCLKELKLNSDCVQPWKTFSRWTVRAAVYRKAQATFQREPFRASQLIQIVRLSELYKSSIAHILLLPPLAVLRHCVHQELILLHPTAISLATTSHSNSQASFLASIGQSSSIHAGKYDLQVLHTAIHLTFSFFEKEFI